MIREEDITVEINMVGDNKMTVRCAPVSDSYLYAFQLFCNGKMVDRVLYSEEKETLFWLSQTGEYVVRACIKEGNESAGRESEPISFVNKNVHLPQEEKKRDSLFQKVRFIQKEIMGNFMMLCRIARYDYKLLNKDSYLGRLWSFLTPLIQIATYWLVFGLGIRNGGDVNGHPFLLWMLCGLVPWFFMNEGIMKGAGSIYSKANVVTKMKYPISTVPVSVIVTAFMEHVMVLLILFVTLIAMGYYPDWYYLNLVYYMLYSFVFLCSLSLITSVLTMLARDFQKLLSNVVRLLFYITPILWSMERMPAVYQNILQFNPILYAITGFRDTLLYKINFWEHPYRIAFFWALNIVLFVTGCNLQYKYRKKFNDLL